MDERLYLRVPAIAERLGKTTSHVHRMIREGKLAAVRKSAHDTRVPIWALDAYVASIQTPTPAVPIEFVGDSLSDAISAFEGETGMNPKQWIVAWKRDEIEDSVVAMTHTIRALGLVAATGAGTRAKASATPAYADA